MITTFTMNRKSAEKVAGFNGSLQQFDLVLQLLLVGQFIPALITR